MRNHLQPLPKLAVSAKLICLLMVVFVGGVSSITRYVKLYNKCAHSFIMIQDTGVVVADPDVDNSVYQNLTLKSVGFSGNLTIYNMESRRYLCFTLRRWRLFGSKRNRGAMCQFREEMVGSYTQYRSVVDPRYRVGFLAHGRPVQWGGRRQRAPARCFDFIKLDQQFNIDEHHRVLSGAGSLAMDQGRALRLRHARRRRPHSSHLHPAGF